MDEHGFARTVTLLVVFGLVKFSLGQECDKASYALINDPYRSTNAAYGYPLYQGICDKYLVEGLWYRFDSYVGNTIPERAANDSVARYKCGTLYSVYIVGLNSHPTGDNQMTTATVGAGDGQTGGQVIWNATILIHKCPAQGNTQSYFLYQLKKVPSCDMAYCAGEGVPCDRDYHWTGSACVASPEPCENYQLTNMANGFRSSDYDSWHSTIALCDANIDPGTWYRFEHISGNRLIKGPIDPWYCGTEAPIWLIGDHPTGVIETTVQACATFDAQRTCQWSGFARIRLCSEYSETFYIYLLPVPPGCPLSYCVDATSRRNCTPPEVWISNEYRCRAPTTAATANPSTKPVSTTTTPTPTFSPGGWGSWESWSECSSQCGFGLYTRRRLCAQSDLPCDGQSTNNTACGKSSCEVVGNPEERTEGIVLILGSVNATQDTLSVVLQNEDIIYELLRLSLNRICSNNASLCCGSNYTGNDTYEDQYVTLGNVYKFPGSLHVVSGSGGNVSVQIIAVVDENLYQTVCMDGSQSHSARRRKAISKHFVSFPTFLKAALEIAKSLLENLGLIFDAAQPKSGDDESANGCPVSTCVVPLVVAILGVICVIIGLISSILKFCGRDSELQVALRNCLGCLNRRGGDGSSASTPSATIESNNRNDNKKGSGEEYDVMHLGELNNYDDNEKKESKASHLSETMQSPTYCMSEIPRGSD